MMSSKTRNAALVVVVVLLVCSAVVTLLPSSGWRPNDLGYVSICPFAPWSTLALLMAAGLVWAVRGYLKTNAE